MIKNFFRTYLFYINLFLIIFSNISYAEVIEKITINGNQRISSKTISIFSNVKIKQNINNEDLNNIVKSLYETNFFSDVKVSFINSEIIINVVENPIIQNLIIKGIDKSSLEKLLYSQISLKNSSSYVDSFVEKDLDKIKFVLQEVGFYFANVETLVKKNDNSTVDLIYDIDLGQKSYIGEILFIGDKKFKSGRLSNIIASEEKRFWKVLSSKKFLNRERINLDLRLLKNFYKNKGYYNVIIESNTVNYNDNQNFQLVFNINSGKKYFFNNFNIVFPDDYDPKFFNKITDKLNKSKGSIYSYRVIEKTLEQIENIALNKSYEFIDATINEVINETNKIDVNINLSESNKIYVQKINLTGNNITIEDVIRNQLAVDEGDGLNNVLLKKSINDIKSLNIFKNVEYNIQDGNSSSEKIINIDVTEKPTGEISLGAGVGSSGASTSFGIRENNFLGKGVRLNANFSLGTESVRGIFAVTNPNYNNTDKSVSFVVESSETDRIKDFGYKTKKNGFSLGTRFEHLEDFFISPTISAYYESLDTSATASAAYKKQEGSYFDTIASYTIDYDKRDQVYQPTSGYMSSFSQEIPLITDNKTIINGYEVNFFKELLPDVIGAASFFVKAANSLGDKDVRISDRQFIPSKKLRGFEPGKVGPIDNGDYVGGNFMSSLNFSSQLPILKSLESTSFNLFLDMANVWGVDYSSAVHDSSKIRSSTGLSADWFTPIGPLNFSLSQTITKKKTDKAESFRFNLGTTF